MTNTGEFKERRYKIFFFFPYMCATTFNTHNKPYESNQVKMTLNPSKAVRHTV